MNVFISYRRDDSSHVACRLYDELGAQFGHHTLFKDVDSIRPGIDFRDQLYKALSNADVVIVLIGDHWVNACDDNGNRRLECTTDFVRMEIEESLSRGIPVVPLLCGKASLSPAQLPPSLAPLAYRQTLPLRAGPDFRTDLTRLFEYLKHLGDNTKPADRGQTKNKNRIISFILAVLLLVGVVLTATQNFGVLSKLVTFFTSDNGEERLEDQSPNPIAKPPESELEESHQEQADNDPKKSPFLPDQIVPSNDQPIVPQQSNDVAIMRYPNDPLTTWKVWNACDGIQATHSPSKTSTSNPFQIDFLKELVVLEEKKVPGDGVYYKVGEASNQEVLLRTFGWMRAEHLILGYHALEGPSTKIFRKAMFVNRAEAKTKLPDFKDAPYQNAKVFASAQMSSNFYYIFAETLDFVLLGTRPVKDVNVPMQKIILGWSPKSEVVEWNTAEAIEWDFATKSQRQNKGKIYGSVKDAKNAMDNPNSNVPAIFVEGESRLAPQEMRYPILEAAESRQYKGNQLFKIGVFARIGSTESYIFREGYVWRYCPVSGETQFRLSVLIHRLDLEEFVRTLRSVTAAMEEAILKSEFEGIAELRSVSSDSLAVHFTANLRKQGFDTQRTLEDQLFRVIGLEARPLILKRHVADGIGSIRLFDQERINIEHSCDRLGDVLNGVEREWQAQKRDGLIYYQAIGVPKNVERKFHFLQNKEEGFYYWIDANSELP